MKGPVTAYIYVTLRCNARCEFCTIWHNTQAPTMELDTGLRIVNELTQFPVRHVDFTGGEPLINRHLPAFLRRAKEHGFFTSVTTNGIAYCARADELHGLIDMLSFSLNGPDAGTHNAKEGVPCFEKVIAGLEKARGLGENVRAQFTVTEESLEYLPETAELARSLGVPLHVLPVFSYFGNDGLSQKAASRLRRMRLPGVRLNPAAMLFHRRGGNNPLNPRCMAGKSAIAIDPTGQLLLPCFHRQKGSVDTSDGLKEAYYSYRAERLKRLAGRMEWCKGCTNWCYINPSFVMKPDIYCLLHIKFALGNLKHIFGLRPERIIQAWQGVVERRCPTLVGK